MTVDHPDPVAIKSHSYDPDHHSFVRLSHELKYTDWYGLSVTFLIEAPPAQTHVYDRVLVFTAFTVRLILCHFIKYLGVRLSSSIGFGVVGLVIMGVQGVFSAHTCPFQNVPLAHLAVVIALAITFVPSIRLRLLLSP
jgi:hypothetical protein